MPEPVSRRRFLQSAVAATAGSVAARAASGSMSGPRVGRGQSPAGVRPADGPIVIASANGRATVAKAFDMIQAGRDPLDAVVAGVNIVEEDPNDRSVGYGGLPNEDGVVELDSCVMHGPTHNAGAVAALRNIKTPSRVAQRVMERTDHVLLVGEGALRFARAHGFEECNLLTDEARRIWLEWKESRRGDDWLPPSVQTNAAINSRRSAGAEFSYGTINCCGLDAAGNLAGVTTTSGLSYKIPGRVGDSPIIGAGLYVDNAVGAAGSTGRGESVILNCGAFTVVELMRQGLAPVEACLTLLRRMVDHNLDPRLRDDDGRPNFDVKMYAVAKDGTYGAASIWSGAKFAVASGGTTRLEDCAYLFDRRTRGE